MSGDNNPSFAFFDGHNKAVAEHVAKYGLPWNSRLPFLQIIEELAGYFRANESESTQLTTKGGSRFIWNGMVSLRLDRDSISVSSKEHFSIDAGNPEVSASAKRASQLRLFVNYGDSTSTPIISYHPPKFVPAELGVGLWIFQHAKSVQYLPGPVDSHLVIFRFSDYAPHDFLRPPPTGERFVALDTQLCQWIPEVIVEI